MELTKLQRDIYARQLLLEDCGEAGQARLLQGAALVCGCGGLGSSAAYYLSALGIGRLGLIDGDVVSPSNLNRQILYTRADLGQSKVVSAARRLRELNPELRLDVHQCYVDAGNVDRLIAAYDIVVDCLDNFPARLLLNDACVAAGKPLVHAGVYNCGGQQLTVNPGHGPCLRCVFPDGADDDADGKYKGIIGAAAGVFGSLQALQAYKFYMGLPLNDQGFLCLANNGEWSFFPVERRKGCICGKK
ncbi:MAG: HesA/MoeB/ThiF family protein [Bacillota bacterium]|nr:HesA/MoeB/ThiF family protein [Bacillota bacterium]